VVAQAVLGMSRTLCPDRTRASIAALAAALVLGTAWPQAQLVVVAAGALLGVWLCRDAEAPGTPAAPRAGTRRAALWALAVFAVLLVVAEVAPLAAPPGWVALSSAFYRAGALVFGGGHVVLPLLTSTVVEPGWVGREAFLSGYGMAQAVPGPLFTVAAYLGAVASPLPGVGGGLVALVAIFLPGLLLLAGTLPFWEALRAQPHARAALRGVNAAVVGMLGAALYDPLWVSAVHGPSDVVIALIAFVGLVSVRLPSVAIVLFGIAAGAVWGG
jgi:chromate transporter